MKRQDSGGLHGGYHRNWRKVSLLGGTVVSGLLRVHQWIASKSVSLF